MTRVLVTGGTGFIGSNLVRALVENGKQVRVFDNDFRGKIDNLRPVQNQIEFIEGDIRDINSVRESVKGVDTVYHLAYINGTENFYNKPDLVLDVGVRGVLNILDAAAEASVKKFIYASSSEVYQTPPVIPTPEDVPCVVPDVKNPRYSYGGGKLIGELLVLHYAKSPMQRIIFRPHNIYGPSMGWEHVIPQFVKRVFEVSQGFEQKNVKMEIQGNGEETRAFCYIDDAVAGIMIAANQGADGEIYHVGKEEEISISELIQYISAICGITIAVKPTPLMKGSTPRRCPDISKLRSLGYSPKMPLRDGLQKTIQWYREALLDAKVHSS